MKKIPLTQGKFALVDDEDYGVLVLRKWHYSHYGYAAARGGRNKTTYMHRVLSSPPLGLEVDHINGDRLDNRRENLRNVTRRQNNMNRKSRKNTSSQFKGVHFRKDTKKYTAYIDHGKNRVRLGCFNTEKGAALAYNEAAIKRFGEFARLNII
jgi:hypothetical protein